MVRHPKQKQSLRNALSSDRIAAERPAAKQARRLKDLQKLEAGESPLELQARNAAFKPGSDVHIERPKRQKP